MQKLFQLVFIIAFAILVTDCNSTRFLSNLKNYTLQELYHEVDSSYRLVIRNWDKKNRTVLEIINRSKEEAYILATDSLLYNPKTKTFVNNLKHVKYYVIKPENILTLQDSLKVWQQMIIRRGNIPYTKKENLYLDTLLKIEFTFVMKADWYFGQKERYVTDTITKQHNAYHPLLHEVLFKYRGRRHLLTGKQFETAFGLREEILF
ncbi:MAG: hypothetical protein NW207_05125 [Cytophagales bacterium]|nr:hypothetical protein [Cytophagales bacterium]